MCKRLIGLSLIGLSLVILLNGCVTSQSNIGASVTLCCPAKSHETFELETVRVPRFMSDLLAANLGTVLAIKGLQPVTEHGDLKVRISYLQEDLAMAVRLDDFDERVSEGGDVRFIAEILVEMVDQETRETVFSGSIKRIHDVSPGEYMHTGRASEAIFESFSELFEGYSR